MKTRFQKICQSGCVCSLKYLELIFGNIKCNLIMKLLRLQNMKEKYRDFHLENLSKSQISVDILNKMEIGIHT